RRPAPVELERIKSLTKGGCVMSKRFIMVLVLALAMLINLPAAQAYGGGHGEKGKSCRMGDISEKVFHKAHSICAGMEELGLSDEQIKKVKDLKIAAKKDLIRKESEIALVDVDMQAALWADPIDTKILSELIDKKYELKKAMAKDMIKAYTDMESVLTAEQKSKLKGLCPKGGRK
ncbi:MAG: Spy/CpxP family protein refolding chaperone, partial [Candidatus Omnitrophica bacterium]|nr:Spy/CpxP family protein refolding chaperone [Candidatus Omnitrophota bacterium]